jgi:hypothetical protein
MSVGRFLFVVILWSGIAASAYAQPERSNSQSSAGWSNGTILTNEEEELSGKLLYNDLQCILFYHDGKTEKTFSSRQVKMFWFFDSLKKANRYFYSLEFEDRKFNVRQPMFFELIKEFKTFAVLTKVDPVQFNEAPGQPRGTQYVVKEPNGGMRIQQFETICFMSSTGLIEPYLELDITIKNGVPEERVRNKQTILNKDLFEKYFGEKANHQIMTFVKHNELQLNHKEDFLKILEYYEKYLVN